MERKMGTVVGKGRLVRLGDYSDGECSDGLLTIKSGHTAC